MAVKPAALNHTTLRPFMIFNMDNINQAKPDTEFFEVVKPIALQQLPLPEELASWESHDLKKLEKSLVGKLDCFLLPAVVILFLMNILDRSVCLSQITGVVELTIVLETTLPMQRLSDYRRH